jgi:hypothetical protein
MPKAVEVARRAVALDPSLAEAHNALAVTSLMYTWDTAEAEREFTRSIQLNPKDIQALTCHGFYLQLCEGRVMEGMEHAKLVLASDPLSGYAQAVYAVTCLNAGRIAEGVEVSRRAVHPSSHLSAGSRSSVPGSLACRYAVA